jgi:hypothetical protein
MRWFAGIAPKFDLNLMNDPAASGRGFRQKFSFKTRGKPRGIKPTGGIETSTRIMGIIASDISFFQPFPRIPRRTLGTDEAVFKKVSLNGNPEQRNPADS